MNVNNSHTISSIPRKLLIEECVVFEAKELYLFIYLFIYLYICIYIIFTSQSAYCRLEAWWVGFNSADEISVVKRREHLGDNDGIVHEGLDVIVRHMMRTA